MAGAGLILVVLNILFLYAVGLGQHAQRRLDAAMTVCIVLISFITAAGIATGILDVLIISLLEHLGQAGRLKFIGGDSGLLLVICGVVLSMMALAIAVAYRRRAWSAAEPISPFFDYVFTWGIIAFLGALATMWALLFCLKLVVIIRAVGEGAASMAAFFFLLAAANLGLFVWSICTLWTQVTFDRKLSRMTQDMNG
jgi:hypothetical protein